MWKHKKYKLVHVGYYGRYRGDRFFYLKNPHTQKQIEFSSHEAAKKAGWTRISNRKGQ